MRRRRVRTRSNGWARRTVGALIAVSAVLSPWQSGLLPEPLDRLGAEPALAQRTAVIDGTPALCDSTDINDLAWKPHPGDGLPWMPYPDPGGRLCRVAGHPPCPRSPLAAGGFMNLLELQADLCEAVAGEADDPRLVADCLRLDPGGEVIKDIHGHPDPPGVPGYVNIHEISGGAATCRLRIPSGCAVGLYRVSSNECVGYLRRPWTCPASHPRRLNQFNRCYGPPALNMSSGHPACSGAPDLATVRCEDYVGDDVVSSPQPGACDRHDDVVNTVRREIDARRSPRDAFATLSSNAHWCTYAVRHLHIKCNGGANPTDPDCDPQRMAACVMRASGIGGCDGIARTMVCRDLQAAYAAVLDQSPRSVGAEAAASRRLQENECTPCVVLPFDAVSHAAAERRCGPASASHDPGRLGLGPGPRRDVPRADSVDFGVFAADRLRCATLQSVVNQAACEHGSHDTSAVLAAFTRQSYTDFGVHAVDAKWRSLHGKWGAPGYSLPQGFTNQSHLIICKRWQQSLLDDMSQADRPQRPMPPECARFLCPAPTAVGRVDWASRHASGLAVVNTPVNMTISEMPLNTRTIRFIQRRFPGGAQASAQATSWPVLKRREIHLPAFFASGEVLEFTQGPSLSRNAGSTVSGFLGKPWLECSLRRPDQSRWRNAGGWDDDEWVNPEVSLIATELWPDEDSALIEQLFGEDSLRWWRAALPEARAAASAAHGYRLTDGLSDADRDAELGRRAVDRVQVFPCQDGAADRDSVTCHWMPTRGGYYAMRAAGIWKLRLHVVEPVRLLGSDERTLLNTLLADDTDYGEPCDGSTIGTAQDQKEVERSRDHDCRSADIDWMFRFPPAGVDLTTVDPNDVALVRGTLAQAVGLEPDLSALLPNDMFPVPNTPIRRCLALQDFRYTCGESHGPTSPEGNYRAAGYTESEPVGIVVHGAHVVTRR